MCLKDSRVFESNIPGICVIMHLQITNDCALFIKFGRLHVESLLHICDSSLYDIVTSGISFFLVYDASPLDVEFQRENLCTFSLVHFFPISICP